jgi:GTPase SAR1 family protein
MNDKSKSNSGSGIENVFVPLIEEVTASMTKGLESGFTTLSDFVKNGFKFNEKENTHLRLNSKMLANNRQYDHDNYLGWAVNYERPFHFNKLDPSKHVFLIGASGWGKTNLINLLMQNALKKKQAIIFIDPKGNKESIADFKKMCRLFGRNYAIFSEYDPEAISFNPIADMTNTQRVSTIMRSFDWGESPNQYFINQSAKALSDALETLSKDGIEFDLADVYKELKSKHNTPETSGLLTQLQLILNSDFGKCFKKGLVEGKPSMTMKQAYENKTCIYIGCSTQGYSAIARTVGKIFVSEAMNLSYWIGKTKNSNEAMENGIGLFIDEAGSVLYPDFIDLVNKCRSSGINIYTAIQSYSDIEMIGGGETLMKQLFESYSTWLLQRQTNPENAEKLAQAFGTYLSEKTTTATDKGSDSGRGSTREAFEYYCHPDLLKSIDVGKTILLSHSPKEHAIINVRNFKTSSFWNQNIEERKNEPIGEVNKNQKKGFSKSR